MREVSQSRRTLPAMLLVEQKPCLVVGAGAVATRKIRGLLDAGARLVVVAPEVSPEVQELSDEARIVVRRRDFEASDLRGKVLVVAATNVAAVNRQVLMLCREARILVSMVDEQWGDGDYIAPGVIRRGDLTVAVSSGGASPRVMKQLRQDLEKHLDELLADPLYGMFSEPEKGSSNGSGG